MKNKTSIDKSPKSYTIWMRMLIVVLILFIYGKTAHFEFTLDDDIFYQKHESVQKGFDGIGELFTHGSMEKFDGTTGVQPYRPITLLGFAIEKQWFDNSTAASHWINVLLYILLAQLLFSLFLYLFPDTSVYVLFGGLLLFILHPVHTEVVASVKSRDELWMLIFGVTAWKWFSKTDIHAQPSEKKPMFHSLMAAFFLLLSLLSKESGIAFLVVLPLSAFLLQKQNIKSVLLLSLPLLLVTIFFLLIRVSIVGTESAHRGIDILDNTLYAAKGWGEIYATRMEIMFHYLKLLFVPWPLSWDYSFSQLPVMNWSYALPWISLFAHLTLLVLAVLYFRKLPALSFFILFYFVTMAPTNNFFFNNGATIAERFLFTPSLAFVFIYSFIPDRLFNKKEIRSLPAKAWYVWMLIPICIFSVFTIKRTDDWQNNFSLFITGVEACPNSSRANQALATAYENKALEETDPSISRSLTDSALQYFKKSIDILPGNADATYKMAQICEKLGKRDEAKYYYKSSIKSKPSYYVALNNLGVMYASEQQWDSALIQFNGAYKADPGIELTLINLMVVHFNKSQFDQVVKYGEEAMKLNYNSDKIRSLYNQAKDRLKP